MRTVLFAVLVFASVPGHTQNADIDLLYDINRNGTSQTDAAAQFISNSVTPVSIGEPVGMFLYAVIKKDSTVHRRSLVIAASELTAALVSTSLKYAIDRPRPFETYYFIVKKSDAGSPSFPSGHTSAAFSAAASLSFNFPKWYVIAPSFLWAASVGYSRMELGVHYPTDVLAGALIGTGSAWLAWKLNKKLAERRK